MAAFFRPQLYKNNSNLTVENTKYVLKKYRHLIQWKKNPSILEVGVGDGGNSLKSLRQLGPQDYKEFVYTDLSKIMIDFAKNEGLPRSEFHQMDIACEKIPDGFEGRFDHIFSAFTLMFVKNQKRAFTNIYNMLKPGGHTFHIFPVTLPTDDLYQSLLEHPRWGKHKYEVMISPYHEDTDPEKRIEDAFQEAGFKNCTFSVEDRIYKFGSEEEWKGFFFSVNAATADIPDEEIEEFKEYFLDRIQNEVLYVDHSNDNNLSVKFKICVLSGSK